jgi:hypothetical protein
MTAITARFRTGQKEPQIPKLDRTATGNGTWYFAPMRPVRQIKMAAMKYPTQTQIQDCHHERPSTIIEEEIIQVFYTESVSACLELCRQFPRLQLTIFSESAIQKAMKLNHFH